MALDTDNNGNDYDEEDKAELSPPTIPNKGASLVREKKNAETEDPRR